MGPYIGLAIVMAAIFGICFLVDKGFTKLFRNQAQHRSGLAVRLHKRYGSFGLIMAVLGVAGVVSGVGKNWLLFVGGCLLVVTGLGLVIYYMSCAIFYDDEGFVYSSFGKRATTYRYEDIQGQQLYTAAAGTILELHMANGKAVLLQPNMIGLDGFIIKASEAWFQQKGINKETCEFYNPDNSCWFPPIQ